MERVIFWDFFLELFSEFDRHSSGFRLKIKSLKFSEKKSKNSLNSQKNHRSNIRVEIPQINRLI
jgi:hypothetical protein